MDLSVVIPMYNESAVAGELIRRIHHVLASEDLDYEILVVDDCSTDQTHRILSDLTNRYENLRVIQTPRQSGQFAATKAGLAQVKGGYVITMDGDLQDPPEVLHALLEKTRTSGARVVFAIKGLRHDPWWFIVGQSAYHWLQAHLSATPLPRGAGSFALFTREIALAVSRCPVDFVNISSILAALVVNYDTILYEKSGRYDAKSRVGLSGLSREAIGSLFISGALHRLLMGFGAVLVVLTPLCTTCGFIGVLTAAAGGVLAWRRSRLLALMA